MDILVKRSRFEIFVEQLFRFDWGKSTHKKYTDAIECLNRAEYCMDRIGIEFSDQDSYNLPLVKNKWVTIAKKNAIGVHKMGIHMGRNYWSILTYIEENGYINPHIHTKDYEIIKMIEGKMKGMVTGKVFKRGDTFIIPKGRVHHLMAEDGECYMYMLFTKNSRNLKLPHQETEFVEEQIKSENGKMAIEVYD